MAATFCPDELMEAEGLNDDYEFPTWSECTWVSDHGRVIFVADCLREAGLEGEAMSLESAGKTRTRC